MNEKQTLNNIIEEWLKIKKITLKESTYYNYVFQINQYIKPYFKDIEMEELEKFDLNIFVGDLMKILKASSLKNVIVLLKSILEYSRKKYEYKFAIGDVEDWHTFVLLGVPTKSMSLHKKQEKALAFLLFL